MRVYRAYNCTFEVSFKPHRGCASREVMLWSLNRLPIPRAGLSCYAEWACPLFLRLYHFSKRATCSGLMYCWQGYRHTWCMLLLCLYCEPRQRPRQGFCLLAAAHTWLVVTERFIGGADYSNGLIFAVPIFLAILIAPLVFVALDS